MKRLAKRVLGALAPDAFAALQARRENRYGQRLMQRLGVPETVAAFVARHGWRVLSGPFAGMAYIESPAGSSLLPKLIGCYERELHEALTEILARPFDTVVDIGCAEGYYAVGLARALPAARVLACDINPDARRLCAELARRNDVADRVRIIGECTPGALEAALHGRSLVVCDGEGCEDVLLDPAAAPRLAAAEILVETHDFLAPGVTQRLEMRFAATHDRRRIVTQPRDPADYPAIAFLPPNRQRVAVEEFRHGAQTWLHLRPLSAALSTTRVAE